MQILLLINIAVNFIYFAYLNGLDIKKWYAKKQAENQLKVKYEERRT